MSEFELDLVVLVSDKNMEWSVKGLLSRPSALGIRPIRSEIYVHPHRDPGCLLNGHEYLRSMSLRFAHALVMFDYSGSGRENQPHDLIQRQVTTNLEKSGWNDRAKAIVLNPELEIWIWSDSSEVDRSLGWVGKKSDMRSWLREQGMWTMNAPKPKDPKAAMELCLRCARKPRSSSIYRQIAERVSFHRCTDQTFSQFLQALRSWFPV